MTLVPGSRLDFPFELMVRSPAEPPPGSLLFVFRRDRRLLVVKDGDQARIPTLSEVDGLGVVPSESDLILLGRLEGVPAYVTAASEELGGEAEVPEGEAGLPEAFLFGDLRKLAMRLPEAQFWVGARGVQILEWDRDHSFCGRCGGVTENHDSDRAKVCKTCGLHFYPRLAPAVIVLVDRGDQVLLARSSRFPAGFFSTLAGFVEAGESLEQAIVREIEEEVGVRVGNLRYFGSQPWPFPHSLMIGFRASWITGEISPDPEEIAEAAWFSRDGLPIIPPSLSIARSLIDAWIAEGPAT